MRRIKRFSSKRSELFFRTVAILLPLVSALLLLSQSAFAQNTYVITDGDRVVVHTTSATDPKVVLDEAGLALGDDDTYTTQGGEGISEITVRRYQTVSISNCGQMLTVDDAHSETVEALLQRLGIPVDDNTIVSVPLDTVTYEGMEFSVTRMVYATETYTKTIPYEVKYCNDSTVPAGMEIVASEGEHGEMICTAEVTYRNGQQIAHNVTDQVMLRQPSPRVIRVGTGPKITPTEKAENVYVPVGGVMGGNLNDASAVEEAPESKIPEQMQAVGNYPIIGDGTIITATGEVLTYTHTMPIVASAYTKTDEGCDDWTSTGTWARVGAIAVDPSVIPYGTRMYIVTADRAYIYGLATAEDCGGAIVGNRVDLYFDTTAECFDFGMRDATIYFLG